MANEDLNQSAQDFSSELGSISTQFKYITGNMEKMSNLLDVHSGAMRSTAKTAREISNSLVENKDVMDQVIKGEVDLNKVKELQKKSQERINDLQRKKELLVKGISRIGSEDDKKKLKSLDKQMKKAQRMAKAEQKALKDAAKQAQKGESRVSKGLSGMASKMKGIGLKGVGAHFEKMAVSARKTKQEGGGLAKVVDKKLVGGIEKFGKMNLFGTIVGILMEAAKATVKLNQEVVDLGRGLGVSLDKARDVRQHFVNMAADVKMLGVEYADIMKSSNALNDSLGTSVTMISGDIINGMAVMEKRMKITAESTLGFAKAAIASQKSVRQLSHDALEGALATEKEFGVRVDLRKVIEKTGKVSGQLRGIYGNNFNLLAKTVAKAQLLGMTMQDVANSSKSMLNFQSSIESEMKAELFLGRQLNLEQARLAALTGDHSKYMDEIVKNAGDFVDFSQMNVMQQNALAESLGLSTDQLADMLLQQADLNQLKEKARDIGAEEAEARLQEISAQEAFNESMEKLKNIFINIMKGIEDFEIPKWMARLMGEKDMAGKKIFEGMTELTETGAGKASEFAADRSIYGDNAVVAPAINDFSIGGLKLKTHPLDSFKLVGGSDSSLNNTPSNNPQQTPGMGSFVVKQEKWDTAKYNIDTTKYNNQ